MNKSLVRRRRDTRGYTSFSSQNFDLSLIFVFFICEVKEKGEPKEREEGP